MRERDKARKAEWKRTPQEKEMDELQAEARAYGLDVAVGVRTKDGKLNLKKPKAVVVLVKPLGRGRCDIVEEYDTRADCLAGIEVHAQALGLTRKEPVDNE